MMKSDETIIKLTQHLESEINEEVQNIIKRQVLKQKKELEQKEELNKIAPSTVKILYSNQKITVENIETIRQFTCLQYEFAWLQDQFPWLQDELMKKENSFAELELFKNALKNALDEINYIEHIYRDLVSYRCLYNNIDIGNFLDKLNDIEYHDRIRENNKLESGFFSYIRRKLNNNVSKDEFILFPRAEEKKTQTVKNSKILEQEKKQIEIIKSGYLKIKNSISQSSIIRWEDILKMTGLPNDKEFTEKIESLRTIYSKIKPMSQISEDDLKDIYETAIKFDPNLKIKIECDNLLAHLSNCEVYIKHGNLNSGQISCNDTVDEFYTIKDQPNRSGAAKKLLELLGLDLKTLKYNNIGGEKIYTVPNLLKLLIQSQLGNYKLIPQDRLDYSGDIKKIILNYSDGYIKEIINAVRNLLDDYKDKDKDKLLNRLVELIPQDKLDYSGDIEKIINAVRNLSDGDSDKLLKNLVESIDYKGLSYKRQKLNNDGVTGYDTDAIKYLGYKFFFDDYDDCYKGLFNPLVQHALHHAKENNIYVPLAGNNNTVYISSKIDQNGVAQNLTDHQKELIAKYNEKHEEKFKNILKECDSENFILNINYFGNAVVCDKLNPDQGAPTWTQWFFQKWKEFVTWLFPSNTQELEEQQLKQEISKLNIVLKFKKSMSTLYQEEEVNQKEEEVNQKEVELNQEKITFKNINNIEELSTFNKVLKKFLQNHRCSTKMENIQHDIENLISIESSFKKLYNIDNYLRYYINYKNSQDKLQEQKESLQKLNDEYQDKLQKQKELLQKLNHDYQELSNNTLLSVDLLLRIANLADSEELLQKIDLLPKINSIFLDKDINFKDIFKKIQELCPDINLDEYVNDLAKLCEVKLIDKNRYLIKDVKQNGSAKKLYELLRTDNKQNFTVKVKEGYIIDDCDVDLAKLSEVKFLSNQAKTECVEEINILIFYNHFDKIVGET